MTDSLLKIDAGRVVNVRAETYVGPIGLVWYDQTKPVLRLGDGVTPGGIPFGFGYTGSGGAGGGGTDYILPIATTSTLGGVKVGYGLQINTQTGVLSLGPNIQTDLLPGQDATFNIGSPSERWKTLYLSSGTFYIAGNTVTITTSTILINGIPVSASGGSYVGSQGAKGDPGGYTGSAGFVGFTGSSSFVGSTGYVGSRGELGFAGSIGYAGSRGFIGSQGSLGYTGSLGYVGSQGETGYIGSTGDLGFTGSQGIVGFTGSGNTNNLIFTTTGTKSVLTGYVAPTGAEYKVRTTEITNSGTFVLNLATFTPSLTAVPLPNASLAWDQPCTGFKVTVINPIDYITDYISSVRVLSPLSGAVTPTVSLYSFDSPTASPGGGISWQQNFATNSTATIRAISTTTAGGVASAVVRFNRTTTANPTNEIEYVDTVANFAISWASPTLAINMTDLSGTSFLNSYLTTPYNVAVTGMINPSNYSLAVTSPIGTVTNPLGSGVLTFTTPITKDNAGSSRSIAVTGIFTRPSGVTGSQYQITLSATDSVLSATFIYPSFTVWTNSVSTPPQRGDIVAGTGFRFGVTALADQTRTFAAMVTNSQGIPRVYWLGVRAAASQPTSFKTGASASLLSDVVITTSTVSLSADSPPVGYVPELFRLYGIILQPGNTYVSIS